jgi:Fe(3+) dicitrate transport protein
LAQPESSINYEGGVRFTHRRARVEVIGFWNDYSNLSDVCTFSSGCAPANIDRQFDAGAARIGGVEAFAEHRVALGKDLAIPASVAYTFTSTRFERTFASDDPIFGKVTAGDQMPYVPTHQLNVVLGLEGKRAGASTAVTYVSAMREVAGTEPLESTLATDRLFMTDVSAYVEPIGRLRFYGTIKNLFDDRSIVSRRPFGARPNVPRWVQVGVKIPF